MFSPITPMERAVLVVMRSMAMMPRPDIRKLRAVLRAARRSRTALPATGKRIWVTELSWDSSPPDPFGVPEIRHAKWLADALHLLWKQRVEVVLWFRVVDEAPSPSYAATNQSRPYLPRVPRNWLHRRTRSHSAAAAQAEARYSCGVWRPCRQPASPSRLGLRASGSRCSAGGPLPIVSSSRRSLMARTNCALCKAGRSASHASWGGSGDGSA